MKRLLAILSILVSAPAFSCSFDAECDVGAKCIKSGSSLYGVCVEKYGSGSNPKDSGSKYEYKGYGSKRGNSCSYDAECGIGGACIKRGSSFHGTCTE